MAVYSCPDYPPYILFYSLVNNCFYDKNKFFVESVQQTYTNLYEEKLKLLKHKKKKKTNLHIAFLDPLDHWLESNEEKAAHLTLKQMDFSYLKHTVPAQFDTITKYVEKTFSGYNPILVDVTSATSKRIQVEFKIKKKDLNFEKHLEVSE